MSSLLVRLARRLLGIPTLEARLQRVQEALGNIETRLQAHVQHFADAGFRVYSQWDEDGKIAWLLERIPVASRTFVEFGVEDYSEANTRFLLVQRHWRGLVLDCDRRSIAAIRRDPLYWQHDLRAEAVRVTAENINEILAAHGMQGEIGLLSIDVDGNDYWIWKAITTVRPVIVIVEYNARLGAERSLTVPYDPGFDRKKAHYSGIYYGASLAALVGLGRRKGYSLVGCNAAGNNAFFVRSDRLPPSIPERDAAGAFVPAGFREARHPDGRLAFLGADDERRILDALPWQSVEDE